jgi:CelD/BcsL family acetyltransferase involved in cellulose biosynthesis
MSPWEPGDRFPKYAPKKKPPEHGIKLKQLGTTWWGQRWIEALEKVLAGDSGRLARGRTYARGGRTHDFVVKAGQVKAKVTGSRPKPYVVELALTKLSEEQWRAAIAAMAEKAQFSAELLGGADAQADRRGLPLRWRQLVPLRAQRPEDRLHLPRLGRSV